MSDNSRFIVVEGIDGSGKTTLARDIAAFIRSQFGECKLTKEPYQDRCSAMVAEAMDPNKTRDWNRSQEHLALLFALDRMEHNRDVIGPIKENPDTWHVVSDRYLHSSLAYQSASDGPNTPLLRRRLMSWILQINQYAAMPDLVVFLDVDPIVAMQRIAARNQGREPTPVERQLERLSFLKKVAGTYLEALLPPFYGRPVMVVDANQPYEQVANQVKGHLRAVWDSILPGRCQHNQAMPETRILQTYGPIGQCRQCLRIMWA